MNCMTMDEQKSKLVDLKARQLTGERLPCPRCGRDTMDAILLHNTLSRHADVYICSACGLDEALLDMRGSPIPPSEWACMRTGAPADFITLSATEAVSRVMTEQTRFLTALYERWQENAAHDDFKEYVAAAELNCPGLAELKDAPFRAVYQTADGEIHVRFTSEGKQTKIEAEIVR